MKKIYLMILVLLLTSLQTFSQHLGLTFQEAIKQGILVKNLDSLYLSAVNSDTNLAVFKTESEQDSVYGGYKKMLQDLGNFLSTNNFYWDKPTRCYNRIYFSSNGTIDYFLFNFVGNTEDKPTNEKEIEFQRLLNIFISDYQFLLKADVKFAQCSPVTYMPKKK